MKPKDFNELVAKQKQEDERWLNLKVGDKVYTTGPGFLGFDYFEHVIQTIDINERSITAFDNSRKGKLVTETCFLTIPELEAMGIKFAPNHTGIY